MLYYADLSLHLLSVVLACSIDCLNSILAHFKRYFSHMSVTAHVFMYFLGFMNTRLGLCTVWLKDAPSKNLVI